MKLWKTIPADEQFARQLSAELDLPPLLARVVSGYNFPGVEAVARFLDPRLKDVSDPFLMPQMQPAVARIRQAIAKRETILIYGDYDVDGIVSVVLLMQVLEKLGAGRLVPCLPDRLGEGYGLSVATLEKPLAEARPGLIITADCGISAVEPAAYIRERGIDLVVTDHHEPGGKLPDALAVVNPKLGDNGSLKILSGVGVAFKLCHALLKSGRANSEAAAGLDLRKYLDLVAVGTVADLVPLLEENRVFVRHGLEQINAAAGSAWRALREIAALKGRLDTYHIAFGIAPRLNAAGRLDTAETALELLMTEDEARARTIAGRLDKANRERQNIEARILKEAIAEIDGYFDPAAHYGIVIGRRSWHVGVIGIVASRLVARYNRPVAVIGFDEEGRGRGSARSIAGFSILNGLNECAAVLERWGGHEMAAGMEIGEKNYERFRELFAAAAGRELKGRDITPVRKINAWIQLPEVTGENLKSLERLAPFGQDNPKPVFGVRGVKLTAPPRVLAGKHLRFNVSDGCATIAAVAFNRVKNPVSPNPRGRDGQPVRPSSGESAGSAAADCPALAGMNSEIPEGEIDLAFQIQKNVFNGSETLELNVKDIRKTSAEVQG